MNLKKIIIVLFIVTIATLLLLINPNEKSNTATSKPTVVLSTYALYDIAKHIAKEKFEIKTVLPFGSDAHSYELTPKKMAEIQDSSLFVYSGASLEPWVARFKSEKSFDMSKHVELIHLEEEHHHHHEQNGHEEHADDAEEENTDPHYWLDIDNMQKMTDVLTDEFTKLSKNDKDFFEKNKKSYIENLKKMANEYERSFSSCEKDTIVVNHNAFSYLGEKYGFHIESINGLSNDSMPSPKDIKHILHLIEEKGISVIFFESFASDKLIKSIAQDTGVKVDTLQPLGNITKDEQGMTYSEIMNQNIEKIKQALECR